MGVRRFPAPSKKAQQKDRSPCCQDPSNHQHWDCGCSWGCSLCWVGYRCRVCDACLSHKYHEAREAQPA